MSDSTPTLRAEETSSDPSPAVDDRDTPDGRSNGDPTDKNTQPSDVDAGPRLRVFVTSTGTGGNLGGYDGADQRCNTFASKAGLGGTWVAWLSAKEGSGALERVGGDGPWYLVDGTLAVRSRLDLQNDSLAHPINVNENGGIAPDDGVWTGTVGGKFALRDCAGWTTSLLTTEGTFGSTSAKTTGWSGGIPDPCNSNHRLYCFEK